MFKNVDKKGVFHHRLHRKMTLSRQKVDILWESETPNEDIYVVDNFSTTRIKIDALNQWLLLARSAHSNSVWGYFSWIMAYLWQSRPRNVNKSVFDAYAQLFILVRQALRACATIVQKMFENVDKKGVFNHVLQEKMRLSRQKVDTLGASETPNEDIYVVDNFNSKWID